MSRTPRIALALLLSCVSLSSAQAAVFIFGAPLLGTSEVPPNSSPATGRARVTFDTTAQTLSVQADFSGLTGTTAAAHIHIGAPGVNGPVATQTPSFVDFPLGVTSGSFMQTLDLTLASSFRPGFITDNGGTPASASAALLAGLQGPGAYFNIHTSAFPSGEIRGDLAAIPEPGTWALMIGGFGLVGAAMRRQRVRIAYR